MPYLPVCVCTVCLAPAEDKRGWLDHMYIIMSSRVGAGTRTWIIWKSNKCS